MIYVSILLILCGFPLVALTKWQRSSAKRQAVASPIPSMDDQTRGVGVLLCLFEALKRRILHVLFTYFYHEN